jgi:hypothetical protein
MTKNSAEKTQDIILFTGISGIDIESCLFKLFGHSNEILKIDKEMVNIYRDENNISTTKTCGEVFTEILGLPEFFIDELWTKAFNKIKNKKMDKGLPGGQSYFPLTFHACYYQQQKKEFTFPIDLGEIQKLRGRVKMLIVLIDDCYDIYNRLLVKGEMFYDDVLSSTVKPFDSLIRSIWNLITILCWRENEIAFSRKIANILGIRNSFFVIPVKHPTKTVCNLINHPVKNLQIYYLSHQITAVRKKISSRPSNFPIELKNFAENLLKNCKSSVLFIPDTIDEYRIKEDQGKYISEFAYQSWPLPSRIDDWLFESLPAEVNEINPLNPKKYIPSNEEIKYAISSALDILARKINEQINSRDLTLVEQSKDGMIVYQPYYDGEISSGAQSEADYNIILRDRFGQCDRKTYVIEEQENLGQYRIRQLFTLFENNLEQPLTKDIKVKIDNLCNTYLRNSDLLSLFYNGKWDVNKIRSDIEEILGKEYDFSEVFISRKSRSMEPAKKLAKANRLNNGWNKLVEEINKINPFIEYIKDKKTEYFMVPRKDFENILIQFQEMLNVNGGKK